MHLINPVRVWAALAVLFAAGLGCAGPASQPPLVPTSTFSPAELGDDPTAGAIARSTRQAQATLDHDATATRQSELAIQATQTAAAQALYATATVRAQATGQAVLAAKSAWPLRLGETFKDNKLGWPLGLTKDGFLSVNSEIKTGHYLWTVTIASGNSYFNLVPQKGAVLTDFYATVVVQMGPGNADNQNAYGLSFRHAGDDYGFFGILQSGSYRVLEVHHTGVFTWLQSSTSAIDTHPGQSNQLAVAGVGPDYVFSINGHVVEQLNADFSPGQVGLGVDAVTKAAPAAVDFSNLEIYAP